MYDIAIIGGGPAGLTAALYAARQELKTAIISNDIGGQILLTNKIENYPGFDSISGFDLVDKMQDQVKKYPVDFITAAITSMEKKDDGTFVLHRDDEKDVEAKAVIIASGKHPRQLGIPGENAFIGRGMSYCATCDGPFYRNKKVAVVGGGDSAVQGALELSPIASEVYLLVRSKIRASEIIAGRLKDKENIHVLLKTSPEEISGDKKIQKITVKEGDQKKDIDVDGVFAEIGGIPNSSFAPKELEKTDIGEIVTDKEGKTNISGLFAAGDVTNSKDKQIVISAGEGAIAALSAHNYLLRNKL